MAQKKLADRTTLGVLASVIYISTGVLAGAIVGGCTNPVKETYGKQAERGQRAIEKVKGVQNQVDNKARQIQEQENKMETPQ